MLTRSKRAPLRITLSRWHRQQAETLALVLQELPRIEELTFSRVDGIESRAELVASAPLLRSLSITSTYHTAEKGSVALYMERVDMPKLVHLELLTSHVPWSSPLFRPTVTRLTFRDTSARTQGEDFAQVLRVLGSMPLLQELDLRGVLPILVDDGSTPPELDHYISLPALQHLAVSGTAKSCAFLLQHLKFSVGYLEVECKTMLPAELKILTPIITSKLHGSSSAPAISLQSMLVTGTCLTVWDDVHSIETLGKIHRGYIRRPAPRLKLSISSVLAEGLHDALVSLPLGDVQVCVIGSHTGGASLRGWKTLFQVMPSVRELSVHQCYDDIADALALRIPVPAGEREKRTGKGKQKKSDVLLPQLKVLCLSAVRFRDDLEELDEDPGSVLMAYKKMLETRKKARRQIEKLSIHNSINFGSEDCKSLKGLVKEVDWDGVEDWSEGEEEDDSEDDYSDEDGYGFLDVI